MSFKIGDMSSAVSMFMDNYQIIKKTENYLNGELVTSYSDPETIICAVLPLTSKELKNLPEGEYTTEDKSIVASGSIIINLNDRILAFGNAYEIRKILDVTDLINLKVFVSKKV